MEQKENQRKQVNNEEHFQSSEMTNSSDYHFIQEKIKDRPINRRKLIKKMTMTAGTAIIFGIVACLTFICLEPLFTRILNSDETPELQQVQLAEEEEESLDEISEFDSEIDIVETPIEDMNLTDSDMVSSNQAVTLDPFIEEPEVVYEKVEMELSDYQLLYRKMYALANQVQKSLVTVTAVNSEEDWLSESSESTNQVTGVIVGSNGLELLILAENKSLGQSEDLQITFHDGAVVGASLKKADENTGLAVYAVLLSNIPAETKENYTTITVGNSNAAGVTGSAVIAVGFPLGRASICYGAVTSATGSMQTLDATYQLLTTDIIGSQNASGVLVNMQGKMVGMILQNQYYETSSDVSLAGMENLINAYGISSIRNLIENLSNNTSVPTLGLYVTDVTQTAMDNYGIPQGAYITKVEMDTPAMNVGISSGDVILAINNVTITSVTDYMNNLAVYEEGQTITLRIARKNGDEYATMDVEVKL